MNSDRLYDDYCERASSLGVKRTDDALVASIGDQLLVRFRGGKAVGDYRMSSSERPPSCRDKSLGTPDGLHEVCEKIGDGEPMGMVFKGRQPTGLRYEDCPEEEREKDLITTRILRLRGLEEGLNRGEGVDTYDRYIYLHGTNREESLGFPASAGCLRVSNADAVELHDLIPVHAGSGEGVVIGGPSAALSRMAPPAKMGLSFLRDTIYPMLKHHVRKSVIFLDIDGVVHPAGLPYCPDGNDHFFQPQCVGRLKQIVDKTNALVVLSSTWRECPDLLDEARERLAQWGICIHDTTPVITRNYGKSRMQMSGRCKEIKSWLKDHGRKIRRFVVLDDMDMTRGFPKNCVVVVNGETGLNDTDVQTVTSLLNAGR